jgi:hypothetical protein
MSSNKGGKGGGARKIGSNKEKCKRYKDYGIRLKNKERKLEKIALGLVKAKERREKRELKLKKVV